MKADLQEIQFEVQQQGMLVDALRRQIYAGTMLLEASELWEMLQQAELRLADLLEKQRELESYANKGVILNTRRDAPTTMGPDTTGLDISVRLRMERIPTGIVHLLDTSQNPLVSYEIENVSSQTKRLRLTSYIEGYSASAVSTVEIARRDKVQVVQLPTFFPDRIRQITELTRATLHVQVDDLDGAQELHKTEPIWLLARDSAYLSVQDPATGDFVDLTRYLAAWVTPHTEEVMEILRVAADHHPEFMLAGYQGDEKFVENQVRAIYDALQARKITYINSIICFGQGQGEYMQRIRLPGESLKTRSANCIDGTVLFASLLEAASINPGLVLVPGHAFLAWQTQRGGQWDYLETTMVSTFGFDDAQSTGRNLAKRYQAMSNLSKSVSFFRLLPLAEMRSIYGITPLE